MREDTSLWAAIAQAIAGATGRAFSVGAQRAVGGGCINAATVVEGREERYFVKLNDAARLGMFDAEAAGLKEIAATGAVRVPAPVCWGNHGDRAYLVLEYLERGGASEAAAEELGIELARMHHVTRARYGWDRDNTIGSTPQRNTPGADWGKFWRRHRLGFQLELAAGNGYGGAVQRQGERLLAAVPALFEHYTPAASLLHGDLWSGNCAVDGSGHPVIFDPAVYYGDREADLAMTELFGGFPARFYHAYRDAYPLDTGYAVRKTFYNLYHVLNHLNLFGGGYRSQAERMMGELLSEIR